MEIERKARTLLQMTPEDERSEEAVRRARRRLIGKGILKHPDQGAYESEILAYKTATKAYEFLVGFYERLAEAKEKGTGGPATAPKGVRNAPSSPSPPPPTPPPPPPPPPPPLMKPPMAFASPPATLRRDSPAYAATLFSYLVDLVAGLERNAPTCRAVVTRMGSQVVTSAGLMHVTGIFVADSVPVEVGDQVFLPSVVRDAAGVLHALADPADAGPWVLNVVGPTTVAQRPRDWKPNSVMTEAVFTVGSEGALWGGSEWRAFPKGPLPIVGTDDPVFFPRISSGEAEEGVAAAGLWIRDPTRLRVTNKTSPSPFFVTAVAGPPGTGYIRITGTRGDRFAVISINF